MSLAVGDKVEKWVVEGLLGEGGMASVYRVRHSQLGTVRALKVLESRSRGIRERLLREGRVQALLQHPNIVAVHDVLDLDGSSALLMDLVPGPPLSLLLRRQRVSLVQADMLARRILGAVAHAHRQGLVHRDLKPANVLVEAVDDTLVPKVADFGLAKLVVEDDGAMKTRSGVAMGTPEYMPPEQIRNAKSVDSRADVYSLGVMLYEIVSGQRPFHGDDLVEIFTAAQERRYAKVDTLVADLPSRMATAIEAALSPDREQRPVDAGALLAIWSDGTEEPERQGDLGTLWSPLLELTRSYVTDPTIVAPSQPSADRSDTMASFAESSPALGPNDATRPFPASTGVPVRSRRRAMALVVLGVVGVVAAASLLIVFVALGTFWATGGEPVAVPTPRPFAPSPPPEPPPPAPIVEAPAPVAVVPAPTPIPAVPDPPTRPTPAPTPSPASPPGTVVVTVSGVSRVRLVPVDGGTTFIAPGKVPAGRYDILAFFESSRADPAGRVELAGSKQTVVCSADLLTCR